MDALVKPIHLTLADVLEAIEAKADLKPSRRRDLRSALKRLACMAGVLPEELPLEMERLRRVFETIEPVARGISKKSLTNIRSDVLAAILMSGFRPIKRPHARTALTPPWLDLWQSIANKRIRFGLSRLLRYCSAQGIAPVEVRDATVEAFIADLSRNTLARRIPALRRRVPVLWNRTWDTVPDWPQQRLTIPNQRRDPKLIPLSDFPESFTRSLDDYAHWLACEDPFDPGARSKALRPTSIATISHALRLEAMSGKVSAKKALILAQNAILFELLIHAPLRLRNVRDLTFDTHLSWPRGADKPALLHIEAGNTKNDRPYEAELGEPLASMLALYRERIVPSAIGGLHEAVFVSVQGRRKSGSAIAWHFLRVIREALGIRM